MGAKIEMIQLEPPNKNGHIQDMQQFTFNGERTMDQSKVVNI